MFYFKIDRTKNIVIKDDYKDTKDEGRLTNSLM